MIHANSPTPRRKLAVLALALTSLTPGLAHPMTTTDLMASEVSDDDLASMRGRYIAPNQILSFGVQMSTTWQTPGGGIVSTVTFQVNPQFQPTITIDTTPQGASSPQPQTATSPASTSVVTAGGIGNVAGVTQTIQTAGNSNDVANNIQLNLTSSSQPTSPGAGSNTIVITGPGTYTQTQGNTKTTVVLDSNGLALNLSMPGEGSTLQQVGSQGLRQSVQIISDLNLVRNSMVAIAQLKTPMLGTETLGRTLNSLQGLSKTGGWY
ncbi:hypothetical protein [Oryzomicrobium sp.]|uniref:hypothetical protein n=1 Tax=Oryzomicrobium sp. TaxID=1911578 RepID=UPI0025F86B8C|nr:hypothetical protein [Oryzomicrobium sp.]MCE1242561.1 hypothetical protein [Oryzomicrobium sp.]